MWFGFSKNPVQTFLVAGLCLVMTACGSPGQRDLPTDKAPTTIVNPADGYMLEAGNMVRVTVFNQDNLSGDLTVDPSGNITLPLVGNIRASGVTANELGRRIQQALINNNLLQSPNVSVEVQTFRPFYVLGEVRQPGEFPYTIGMTVLSAIARAGGYDYRALENDVILVRSNKGKQEEFRADELTPILPGDIIRVRERRF
ncbi:polysaccharide export protein [Niveispirillum sp. SYP-B3756]|uniref:polysaccharide biosynthesis/export family protein n=1 Tax=Niveispirillum sp. SYP-B3756 TaxID=2662178 RepID=UPI001290D45A|nr:polysaccharide export protein [Niveispirillum sp. SYP-B3756]